MIPALTLRLVNPDGSYGAELPGWTTVHVGLEGGTAATLQVQYKADAPAADLLADQATVVALLDGTEPPDGRFELNATSDDDVAPAPIKTWKGNSRLHHLDRARVRPQAYPSLDVLGHGFAAVSPGHKLRILLEAAQTRGALPGLTWNFTDATDSSGQPWPSSSMRAEFLDAGETYLQRVQKWAGQTFAVATMVGTELHLYAWEHYGTDLTSDVVLAFGQDLVDGSTDQDSEDVITVMLAITDTDGVPPVERTNNAALSVYGRREGFLSQAGVPDQATLAAIADAALAITARQREEFTYGLAPGTRARPWLDFDRGDVVSLRTRAGTAHRRVRHLTLSWDGDTNERSGTVQFGDRFRQTDEQAADRAAQLAGNSADMGLFSSPLLGGGLQQSVGGGGGGVTPDSMPPAAPTGLATSSSTVFEHGYLSSTAVLDWAAPTQNQDGSPLTDLNLFEVQYRVQGAPRWEAGGIYLHDHTEAVVPRLLVGTTYDWRVRALDVWGNASAWATTSFTASGDASPPVTAPSAPTVATFLYDALLVTWDGLAAGGGAVDNDVRHVEVHTSTVNNFTPGAGTLRTTIDVPGGQQVVTGLVAGTTYYVKLRVVDWAGNIGPSGAQSTGVPASVGGPNIAAGAIGTAHLADLAVTTAKVADLSASKITAGTMTAVVTISGKFTTRVGGTGAGVDIDNTGIKLYNPANNVTVNLNGATGSATFTGAISSAEVTGYIRAISGARQLLLMPVGFTDWDASGICPSLVIATGVSYESEAGGIYTSNGFLGTGRMKINAISPAVRLPSGVTAGNERYYRTHVAVEAEALNGFGAGQFPTRYAGRVDITFPQPAVGKAQATVQFLSNIGVWNDAGVNGGLAGMLLSSPYSTGSMHALRSEVGNLGVTNFDGSAYLSVVASAFNVASDSRTKHDIQPHELDVLGVIRSNPVRKWRRHPGGRFELGPMADTMPDEISATTADGAKAYSVAGANAILWDAITLILDRLERLERDGHRP